MLQESEPVLEWKNAAQKCLSIDPKSLKGHFHLASACWEMMEYDLALKAATKGHVFHPTNGDVAKLRMSIKKDIAARKQYHKDALAVEKGQLAFYGGDPSNSASMIPNGTAYSRLERTSCPKDIKKILKCRDEVKTVMQAFYLRDLRVVWFSSAKVVQLVGYLDGDDAPIVSLQIYVVKTKESGYTNIIETVQNQKWHQVLTIYEKDWLVVLLVQRVSRSKGHRIDSFILDALVEVSCAQCNVLSLYKNAVDIQLAGNSL
jgi:hypothetical protein